MSYQVSFCIPEHNECDLVVELVQSLLSNPDPNFQVIVSDNMTDNADPSEVYRNIRDERFRLYQSEKALSRQENWLRTLERGEGEYLYFIMGRDWLDSGKIGSLLSLLNQAQKNHTDLLIDRKSIESYKPYYGINAINRFVDHEHETGLIISRASLLENQRRSQYFIPGVLYPETFIKRDILATGGAAAMINSGMFANIPTRVSLGSYLSGADPFNNSGSMETVYFSPKQKRKVFYEEIAMVLDDPRFHLTDEERASFFEQKYQKLLQESVFENKLSVQSEEYMMHYGMRRTYVPLDVMFRNLANAALAGYRVRPHLSLRQKFDLVKAVCAETEKIVNGRYLY